jgi:hypothetical protein
MPRRVSAQSLRSKREVAVELLHHGSPYVLGNGIVAALAVRVMVGGPLAPADVVALAAIVAVQPAVEWGLHRVVLHGPARTIAGRVVDPGASHRGHHRTPDDVGGALLGPGYAIADSSAVIATIALLGLVVWPLTGSYPAGGVAVAAAAGCAGLLWYEWAHILFHSGYTPRTAWFRRLRTNHRRHHYRDERRWFGITSTYVDRLAGTASTARMSASG